MSRTLWQALNEGNLSKVEMGTLLVVARPDGKSWSGILMNKPKGGLTLRNAHATFDIHLALNPTASFTILVPPEWKLGFGERRLPL